MRFIIAGCVIVMFGFVWALCAASKQDNWMRKYEERKQQKKEERRRRR